MMGNKVHKLNGFVYVTSEEETYQDYKDYALNGEKIILSNDPEQMGIQQLTQQEVDYCNSVDEVEIRYSVDFNSKYIIIQTQEEVSKETLEEAIKKYTNESFIPMRNSDGDVLRIPPNQTVPCGFSKHKKIVTKHFTAGAKWQSKQMYTEDEVRELLYQLAGKIGFNYEININGHILDEFLTNLKDRNND